MLMPVRALDGKRGRKGDTSKVTYTSPHELCSQAVIELLHDLSMLLCTSIGLFVCLSWVFIAFHYIVELFTLHRTTGQGGSTHSHILGSIDHDACQVDSQQHGSSLCRIEQSSLRYNFLDPLINYTGL